MQGIVLLLSAMAVFSLGLLAMDRLDAFLAHCAGAPEGGASHGESALRIAFSSPMAACAVARSLGPVCRERFSLDIDLYAADTGILLERLYGGQLDVVVIPCDGISVTPDGYAAADILVEPGAVTVNEAALPLRPLEPGCVLQRIVWAKGACGGAADAFAAQAIQDLQRFSGNVRREKV